ncbi:hypothetical protein PsYK624_047010 [Phanerochaete sordida]|uniref:Uncharacterized protein n=1 Tax=Phanerochaete sordida TaxID=48140 RepID=A0A9P3LBZ5_9APHY|nr:hypothetical protein PsYK624_047010 [Phanerochaete sordida]
MCTSQPCRHSAFTGKCRSAQQTPLTTLQALDKLPQAAVNATPETPSRLIHLRLRRTLLRIMHGVALGEARNQATPVN